MGWLQQGLPIQSDATVHCTVYDNGAIGVGSHRIAIGRTHRGHPLTAIRDGTHAAVYNHDGDPIGHAYLDPAKNTSTSPTTKTNNTRHMSRDIPLTHVPGT